MHITSLESPVAGSPQDMSDEELPVTPISPIDMINSSSGSITLVSRMQALHGLANRRRHSDGRRRPSLSRSTFFSEPSTVPSLRRERLLNAKVSGKQRENQRARRLSTESAPLLPPLSMAGPSALDLRGLVKESGPRSPTHASGSSVYTASRSLVNSHAMPLVPSSPASDSSGSQPALSPLSISRRNTDELPSAELGHAAGYTSYMGGAVAGGSAEVPPRTGEIFGSALNSVSTHTANDAPLPISPITYQAPIAAGPLTTASTYASYASNQPMASLSSLASPAPVACRGCAGNRLVGDAAVPTSLLTAGPLRSHPVQLQRAVTIPSMAASVKTNDSSAEFEYVPASAPPDIRGQVPFVFDSAYEAQSVQRLRSFFATMSESGPEEKLQLPVGQGPSSSRAPLPLLGPRYKTTTGVPVVSNVNFACYQPCVCVADPYGPQQGRERRYDEYSASVYYAPSSMLHLLPYSV